MQATSFCTDSDLLLLDALSALQQLDNDELAEILATGDSETKTWITERIAEIKQEADRIIASLG